MASGEMKKRLENGRRDLDVFQSSQIFRQATNATGFTPEFQRSLGLVQSKLRQATPYLDSIEDFCLQPIASFLEQIPKAIDSPPPNHTAFQALIIAKNKFMADLPLVSYGIIEASGMLDINEGNINKFFQEGQTKLEDQVKAAIGKIQEGETKLEEQLKTAIGGIEKKAQEVLESAYKTANKISVKAAQEQFNAAAQELSRNSRLWIVSAGLSFLLLLGFLLGQMWHPPALIEEIVEALNPSPTGGAAKQAVGSVPMPLLIAAGAYFTSIRLAIVGVLGIALAFSLRMARAYLHMGEHNRHKLRVTNSIEAFVAGVRTNEQKDLVLSKLVESVTQFGDSGILANQAESANLPSVILESITKNVGKSE